MLSWMSFETITSSKAKTMRTRKPASFFGHKYGKNRRMTAKSGLASLVGVNGGTRAI
jgi:hypothetical protein